MIVLKVDHLGSKAMVLVLREREREMNKYGIYEPKVERQDHEHLL